MSTISQNIIVGDNGRIFETNAKSSHELQIVKDAILSLKGVTSVHFDEVKYPVEFKIVTFLAVKIKDIEEVVILKGFHAIPKTLLG